MHSLFVDQKNFNMEKIIGKTVDETADESGEFVCTTRPISTGENYAKLRSDAFRFVLARSGGFSSFSILFSNFLAETCVQLRLGRREIRANRSETERTKVAKMMQIVFIRKYALSHWR